jgi:hypothetical protein
VGEGSAGDCCGFLETRGNLPFGSRKEGLAGGDKKRGAIDRKKPKNVFSRRLSQEKEKGGREADKRRVACLLLRVCPS